MTTEIQLNPEQQEAIARIIDMKRRCVAIEGEAGTGKTTIMKKATEVLIDAGYRVALCAPTGKAARRIREATGFEAITLHKLLEFTSPSDIDPKTGKPYGFTFPRRNKENQLEQDVIIVDEYAMTTRALHACLVQAMPGGSRLIVLGDGQQLPPVEENNKDIEYQNGKRVTAFSRLMEKFGIKLTKVHRQDADSPILTNAHRIKAGIHPKSVDQFRITPSSNVIESVLSRLKDIDFASLSNQIITPANVSMIGTHKLNDAIQAFLWADKGLPTYKPMRWKNQQTGKGMPPIVLGVGDKVIITRNLYDIVCSDMTDGVFNGEIGHVIEISEQDEVVIDFGDRVARIPAQQPGMLFNKPIVTYPQRNIELAYAVTTHKAQGSEYDHVLYVITRSVWMMLNRRNIYTAVTRAKQSVEIVYDEVRTLQRAITQREPMEKPNG